MSIHLHFFQIIFDAPFHAPFDADFFSCRLKANFKLWMFEAILYV